MDVLLLLVVLFIFWFWWNATGAKDRARQAALRACHKTASLLLDDAVELKKLWLRRNEKGHIEICRIYFFDFTFRGEERFHAYVLMLGQKVAKVSMDLEDAYL